MVARRGKKAPGPQPRSSSDDDPEVPAWRADYVTCPACWRPVRRERLSQHMKLLHPGYVPDSQPSGGPQFVAAQQPPKGVLRRLLARIRGHGK